MAWHSVTKKIMVKKKHGVFGYYHGYFLFMVDTYNR